MKKMEAASIGESFLTAKTWESRFGEQYELWRKDRWVTSCKETQIFLNHILPLGRVQDVKRLLPHQAEALQRVIYSFEHAKFGTLLCTLATGTGKTVVMASVIAWLVCRKDAPNTFILFCPNTIVRDRLKRDFENLAVFKEFDFFPPQFQERLNTLSCSIVDGFRDWTNLRGYNLIVANRHQFQIGYSRGNDHLVYMQREGGRIAVFNDEAHNTRGMEYSRTLSLLKKQTSFRLDVTATPDRADNLRPQSDEIYSLSVVEAITGSYRHNQYMDTGFSTYPRLIKDVVVQRPSIKTLYTIHSSSFTFTDLGTNKQYKVGEIDWEDWPRKKSVQLVMDPGPMKMQLHLANESLKRKREIAKHRFKPLLFVIAPSILGAIKAVDMMKSEFKLNPLLVVDDIEELGSEIYEQLVPAELRDKEKLREAAATLGQGKSPYDSVVSVYMLREGWDVPEVSIICLLRGFGSPLFAHQVLGRGLRLIRGPETINDNSVQELTVIDHPCLQLDDLWADIDALVLEGDEISRHPEIPRDGEASGFAVDEGKERPPEQIVVRQELYDLLFPIPTPKSIHTLSTERALELLEDALRNIKDYRPEAEIVVGVESGGYERLRPKRQRELVEQHLTVTAVPSNVTDREFAQKAFLRELMEWSKDYGNRYEPFATHTDVVYKKLLGAFEQYVFMGQQCTEVDPNLLFATQHTIVQIKELVTHELNFRIYSEEVLQNE